MRVRERAREDALTAWLYIKLSAKWIVVASVIGALCGLLGSAFHISVDEVTKLRLANPWLILTLPVAGLAITGLYKLTRAEGLGTDTVIEQVRTGKGLKLGLLPAIFFGTVLTHMAGGSAGREGAALQLGGTVGLETGRLLRLDERDERTATMAGMAAFFSALFGTPLTASVFAMSVISVGLIHHAALLPCLTAALTAFGVSRALGVEPTRFAVAADAPENRRACGAVCGSIRNFLRDDSCHGAFFKKAP